MFRAALASARSVAVVAGIGLLVVILGTSGDAIGDSEDVLAGQVVDAEGAPLDGATVYVFAHDDERAFAETKTGHDGRFQIALARPEPVDVRVGKASRTRSDEGRLRWRTLTAEALGVTPNDGPLRLVARTGACLGTARARVRSPDGYATAVQVRAVPTCWPMEAGSGRFWGHTNAIGRVELDDLPRVPVELRVARSSPWCPTRGPVVLPDPKGIDLYRIELERARVLTGRVLDEQGLPLVSWGVMATSAGGTWSRPWGDVTGEDGAFTIGVPESWEQATLLVGCTTPEETSAHRHAVQIVCDGDEEIAIRVEGNASARADEKEGEDEEARRVMETVLVAHYVSKQQRHLVLLKELGGLRKDRDAAIYRQEDIHASTVLNLTRKADVAAVIPHGLDVRVAKLVLPSAWWAYLLEVHGSMNRGIWRHFYSRFPRSGGLVILSPVGFSEDGLQALIHVVNHRARLHADGFFYLLEKRGGQWHVVRRVMTWIS